jgi:hypothetical protein
MKTSARLAVTAAVLLIVLIIRAVVAASPPSTNGSFDTYLPAVQKSITCQVPTTTHPTIQSAVNDSSCQVIVLAAGLFVEQVLINRSVHIHGQGAALTIVDGNNTGRVFTITPDVTVTLTRMKIQHGLSTSGGGIWVDNATLTLQDTILSENQASGYAGGLRGSGTLIINNSLITENEAGTEGAGLYVGGFITITNTTINHNSSAGLCTCNVGGGIYFGGGRIALVNSLVDANIGSFAGGGIFNASEGVLTFENTVISNNDQGGIHTSQGGTITITQSAIINNQGSGIYNDAPPWGSWVTVIDSTISSNNTIFNGGGVMNGQFGTLTIIGSTIYNNSADNGGGIFLSGPSAGVQTSITNTTITGNTATEENGWGGYGGGIYNDATLSLTNVTIAGNTGASGAGLHSLSSLNLINTIVANNLNSPNCWYSEPLTSQGNNLANDSSCNLTASGDQQGVNPLLAPLAHYGGPTWTMALLTGSPAIDTGSLTTCPSTDQRGFSRPIDGDGNTSPICDIGAYEYNPSASP